MHPEDKIIQPDRGFPCSGVSCCILRPDDGRIKEAGGRDREAYEAQHIESRKVNRESGGGASPPVEQWLGIERKAPGQRVDPTTESDPGIPYGQLIHKRRGPAEHGACWSQYLLSTLATCSAWWPIDIIITRELWFTLTAL